MPVKNAGQSGAVVVGPYRYLLWRVWSTGSAHLLWILLNPSRADGCIDDPTLRRILGFSHSFGFGGIEVVNLFALHSPDPGLLTQVSDPVGPENDRYIREAVERAAKIVVAWGSYGRLYSRDHRVLAQIECPVNCLGVTQDGYPRHPLYLQSDLALRPFPSAKSDIIVTRSDESNLKPHLQYPLSS